MTPLCLNEHFEMYNTHSYTLGIIIWLLLGYSVLMSIIFLLQRNTFLYFECFSDSTISYHKYIFLDIYVHVHFKAEAVSRNVSWLLFKDEPTNLITCDIFYRLWRLFQRQPYKELLKAFCILWTVHHLLTMVSIVTTGMDDQGTVQDKFFKK